jgi:hypothetical protein
LAEHKEKLPQDVIDNITNAVADLKKSMESENVEDIKQKITAAQTASMKIGETLMKQQKPSESSGESGTGAAGGQATEAEYEDVKEGKK